VGDSIDDVIGMVDFKDLAVPLLHNRIDHDSAIATWKQSIDRVKEDTHLSDVLSQMQRLQQKMIIVEDDHGGVAGLLTLDDLIAEITGEEPERLGIEHINDKLFLVPGGIDLEELNQEKDLDLPESEEYQTLAGFMIHALDRIPTTGEKLTFQNLELTVMSTKGPRIEKVTIRTLQPKDAEEEELEQES
jgi:CBS domain containing-hemolysin-like protein